MVLSTLEFYSMHSVMVAFCTKTNVGMYCKMHLISQLMCYIHTAHLLTHVNY